ncbi:excinuclease ABC subunit UvrC [Salinisphaera sp. USBA-960]|uniref:excinuclease ABC subunit UvrC n=1 Tax=Salinisphaera orenii TaxID=856731 RepID=UPI000DBE7634|nr:excinuclease ABC subunit UvrC [Salifodinibacter halophilus]NNC25923.1 excinuclease ABC subunit UvrC [Salifodinibacter halophilus]
MSETAFDPVAYVKQLTTKPGVYRMFDASGNLLYVGKAKNLKKRVSSYFLRASGHARTEAMLDHVADVQVTITHTEDEALLLESTLIKRHRPRYNVYLTDDKSYPYLLITGDNQFPRVVYHRGAQKREGNYFGPFPSSGSVRQTQDTLTRLFKLRTCRDSYFENRTRPCLQYQIKRCSAPCVGYISEAEYARDVDNAAALLNGRNEQLIERLINDMEAASARLDFESAAELRERIASVRRLQAQSQSVGGRGDFDIVAAKLDGGTAAVIVTTVRGGNNLGHRSFFPHVPAEANAVSIVSAFLGQYYLERRPPPEIMVDPLPDDTELLSESLGQRAERKVALKNRVRGERRRWLDNTKHTADQSLSAQLASRAGVEKRLNALAEALSLDAPPLHIACFDISHTQGEKTVASCVVFENGAADKSAYRRFNITDIEPGDDYAAMRQALRRRFERVNTGEARMPNLLLIDGGRGQLSVTMEVLDELGIHEPAVVAVAKGPSRKPGEEQLMRPNANEPIMLAPDSAALHLIQQVRDEAHRFAVAGHRGQRGKARQSSTLDDIEGLGPKRRKKLLQRFGGPRQVARAGVNELQRVEGISGNMAQRIYDHFHPANQSL